MSNKKIVQFLLVSYNSEAHLHKCVTSILALRTVHEISVLLVDNASSDGTLSLAKSIEGLQVLSLDKNYGFAYANNFGARKVEYDYLVVFNVDAYFQEQFDLDRVVATLEADERIAVLGARLVYPDGAPQTSAFSYTTKGKWVLQTLPFFGAITRRIAASSVLSSLISPISGKAKLYLTNRRSALTNYGIEDVPWVSGAAMFIRGAYSSKYGLFDDKIFLYGEDEDLCISVKKNGYRVVIQNTHPVVHVHGWGSEHKVNEKVIQHKYDSLKYFIDKHFPRRFDNALMKMLLPIYVRGWYGFWKS